MAEGNALKANKAKVEAGTHRWHKGDVWQVGKSERPHCGARTRAGGTCQAKAMPGGKRCRMHGGKGISGPKTAEGRQAIADANRRRRKTPLPDAAESAQDARTAHLEANAGKDTPSGGSAVQTLTETQERALALLLADAINDADIARQCGVSRRTLARWKRLPVFAAKYTTAYRVACDLRYQQWQQKQAQRKADLKAARDAKKNEL